MVRIARTLRMLTVRVFDPGLRANRVSDLGQPVQLWQLSPHSNRNRAPRMTRRSSAAQDCFSCTANACWTCIGAVRRSTAPGAGWLAERHPLPAAASEFGAARSTACCTLALGESRSAEVTHSSGGCASPACLRSTVTGSGSTGVFLYSVRPVFGQAFLHYTLYNGGIVSCNRWGSEKSAAEVWDSV